MITVEIDIEPIAEDMEAPLKEFRVELRELFEQYGWKVVRVANYDLEE